ncbi:hypothetical protein AB205_0150360 [Aquarana catesbeiana]|uniref:Gamma-soluble NSF attachment protein n=1 Tax=Aquarana catesbeiana TaxID=8400 RepID=A0A2G9P7Y7_AQUCT|nr:hypothetical protein AB205_0150360 [Aquarana catesbeiana]
MYDDHPSLDPASSLTLKTSFLKWKPDYDSAASEYAKAAVAFKNAKQYDQAKDAFLKEAEAYENNKSAFEQAGMMLKVGNILLTLHWTNMFSLKR